MHLEQKMEGIIQRERGKRDSNITAIHVSNRERSRKEEGSQINTASYAVHVKVRSCRTGGVGEEILDTNSYSGIGVLGLFRGIYSHSLYQ